VQACETGSGTGWVWMVGMDVSGGVGTRSTRERTRGRIGYGYVVGIKRVVDSLCLLQECRIARRERKKDRSL